MSKKYYKAFKKGLVCRGKQYQENTIFEEEKAEVCRGGMHFCENPFDVLDYYPLIDKDGKFSDFAEVEPMSEIKTDDGKKYCTKKLKIGFKLSLKGFIDACVDFLLENNNGNSSRLAASGDYSQLAASGYCSQLATSGNSSRLATSGNSSRLAASGYCSQLAASGDSSRLAASGYCSQLAASGGYSQLATSGDCSKLATSGDYSQLATSGNSSQLAASGGYSQLAASGDCSVIAGIGVNNQAKAKTGCWITLAEWRLVNNVLTPICVKTEQVDGVKIKEDVYYQLVNGEFIEV